ncbi:MAG: ABC transporter substrate-binding protein, partial [Acetobacteraceae bacterium]
MDEHRNHLLDEFRAGRMSRRALLRRASVAGIALTSLTPTLGRAATAATSQVKRGGTIRLASQIPAANPESVTASNPGAVFTIQPSLEYLCYPRADWTLDPRLATGWKADPTPKTWTFSIRQGVRWHDGSPLTTD